MADYQLIINSEIYQFIPYGFCACGCGQKTSIITRTYNRYNYKKGRYNIYIKGHATRLNTDKIHWSYNKPDLLIPVGYCQCGCGIKTLLSNCTEKRRGNVKGKPQKWAKGHACRGVNNWKWKEKKYASNGYILITAKSHPRASKNGYVPEHVLVAEKSLGYHLPIGAEVHHFNGIKRDNKPVNLIICQDEAYHYMLHRRQRAYEACGHASWRKCWICKQYDDPKNLVMVKRGNSKYAGPIYHKECNIEYQRDRMAKMQTVPG